MSGMNEFLHRLRILLSAFVHDFVHGVNAGNAIRHGLSPSPADEARVERY